MTNLTPIRNRAVISAIPPVDSIFKLVQPSDSLFEFKSGTNRFLNQEDAPSRIIKFNQCDVLVFPERNVGLQLIEQRRLDDGSYKITVEVENITELEATFAHFSVIHYVGVTIDNDYGFILLKPRQKERITYNVISSISSRTIDLPFFVSLYLPTQLNGFKSLELIFEF